MKDWKSKRRCKWW